MTKDDALTLALDVLERASHSLGSFVSDHGWGQEDMNTLDSVMAAEHRIKEALAQPERPWVGLTPTEVELIVCYPWGETANWVRAIEKALKEKNT